MTEADSILYKLRTDFEYYAPRCLKILLKVGDTKDGKQVAGTGAIVSLVLNKAQLYIHKKLEEQLARIGKIRAIIVKGRQQGASTYVGARFYWKSSGEFGKRVQILTHEIPASQNLFRMTKRFHDNCPEASRPHTGNNSLTELFFDHLDTRYSVATAGTQATGRSATAQYFHGSEVAFWPQAEDHMAGVGQIVPDAPGTEIVLESTGNGIGNLFHGMVQDAMRGRGDYILIFVPWFWEEGYRRSLPEGFVMDDDELVYMQTFGLDIEQMAWRRAKIDNDFRGDVALFNQEYPATVEMAFQASAADALILPSLVSEARTREKVTAIGPLILGCDPAEYGDDDTAFCFRRGRMVEPIKRVHGRGPMELAGILAEMLEKRKPDATCIDVSGGYGRGIIERLEELKFKKLYAIQFGERALAPELYQNRRCEMWGLMRDYIRDLKPVLPDDDVLASDLSAVTYHYDSSRRLCLTSKERMKADGIRSPDSADALALTFAVRVAAADQTEIPEWRKKMLARRRSGSAQSA